MFASHQYIGISFTIGVIIAFFLLRAAMTHSENLSIGNR
jgi:hypothetical protein